MFWVKPTDCKILKKHQHCQHQYMAICCRVLVWRRCLAYPYSSPPLSCCTCALRGCWQCSVCTSATVLAEQNAVPFQKWNLHRWAGVFPPALGTLPWGVQLKAVFPSGRRWWRRSWTWTRTLRTRSSSTWRWLCTWRPSSSCATPNKDVRLLVACCLADIFRIYAPEAPYTSHDKLKVQTPTPGLPPVPPEQGCDTPLPFGPGAPSPPRVAFTRGLPDGALAGSDMVRSEEQDACAPLKLLCSEPDLNGAVRVCEIRPQRRPSHSRTAKVTSCRLLP